uniref:Uncharacterized protein n=1 Tax=Romanomermis culicivorax TaxID=13658 RepID=A0A915HYL9_ROMCU
MAMNTDMMNIAIPTPTNNKGKRQKLFKPTEKPRQRAKKSPLDVQLPLILFSSPVPLVSSKGSSKEEIEVRGENSKQIHSSEHTQRPKNVFMARNARKIHVVLPFFVKN